jgi:ubiquinone/menaquinone biosynthesis C-methylase UbiE
MSPRPDEDERSALFGGRVPELLAQYSNAEANYGAVTQTRLPFFRERIDRLVRKFGRSPSSIRFLDIGASSGYMVQAALEKGMSAEGIEPSASGVWAAKERGITLVQATAECLPFDDSTFDIVHSHHVFEHVADPLRAAKEAYRVLKPGGLVLIEVPNQFDNIRFWRDQLFNRVHQRKRDIRSIHHLSFFSRKAMRDLLSKAGFLSIEIESKYTLTPTGWQILPGYLTMLIGLFYLGGERVIGTATKGQPIS